MRITFFGARPLLIATIGGAVAFLMIASPATAVVLEDATCAPRTGTLTTSAGGNVRMAHPFTVVNSGQLVAAQVGVTKNAGSTGDYVVQIVAVDGSGTPTNTVLAAATIPNASVPNGDQTLTANFVPALNVVAGQQLAVLITRPGSGQFAVGIHSVMTDCPSMRFDSPTQTGGFTGDPATNLFFRIYVDVTPPAPEPEPQAGDPNAPTATITSGPKDKTKKKAATFTFTGTDTRAVASFQCSLDGPAFAPCTSPQTVTVKKGKHTFQVRAVDDSGNVGAPASDSWKRKKKRKK